MFNYRTLSIIKRELKARILTKKFIFMTLCIPFMMILIFGLQAFVITFEGEEEANLKIISESEIVTDNLIEEFSEKEFVKEGTYNISCETMSEDDFEKYLKEAKKEILASKFTGIVFIPSAALKDKGVTYYSKSAKNITLQNKLGRVINKILTDNYFNGRQFSSEDIFFARKSVGFKDFKISKDKVIKKTGYGQLILAYLFSFLLYFSLIMMGTMLMQSVIEEKNNRIVEVLLSSVKSKELMTGKIMGTAITGILQMAIWLSPVIIVASTGWIKLPFEIVFNLSAFQIFYFLINFFVGLIIFLGLFAAVASIFDNVQDTQSAMFPLIMLIMIPFFITISMMKNPTNSLAKIASMFPFASVIVMPARMALIDVPVWQFLVSFSVNILTLILIFPIAGKIYRIGILKTGKKPTWTEVIKWLKYKY